MIIPASPAQIQAIQDGQTVELRILIERVTSDWLLHLDYDILDDPPRILLRSHGGAYDEILPCPVAVGDTVEVSCSAREPAGSCGRKQRCPPHVSWCSGPSGVRTITHREIDGVHNWAIGVSK